MQTTHIPDGVIKRVIVWPFVIGLGLGFCFVVILGIRLILDAGWP